LGAVELGWKVDLEAEARVMLVTIKMLAQENILF
jgi:hypothetical protein